MNSRKSRVASCVAVDEHAGMKRLVWLSLVLLPVGCALPPSGGGAAGSGAAVEYSVETKLRGRIVEASENGGFVVMDFGLAGMPAVGSMVDVIEGDDVVGRIRVSGPARDTIIAGDIVSGEIRNGQQVVFTPEPVE